MTHAQTPYADGGRPLREQMLAGDMDLADHADLARASERALPVDAPGPGATKGPNTVLSAVVVKDASASAVTIGSLARVVRGIEP